MTDVEAINGLHQPADCFLEEISVTEGMMAKALGDVGGQTNIGRGQSMFEVDVAIVQAADGSDIARIVGAVVTNELGHGPGFQGWPMLPEPGETADQNPDQFALDLPEICQQLAFFLGREQIGRKDGGRRHDRCFFGHRLAFTTSRLHGCLSVTAWGQSNQSATAKPRLSPS